MNNKGFVLPSLGMSLLILGILTIAGLSLALKIQSSRLEACQSKYELTLRLGQEQEAKSKATQARQNKTTQDLRREYADIVKRLHDPGTSDLSSVTDGPETAHGAADQFALDCTADALKLAFLQKWIKEQGFPIE